MDAAEDCRRERGASRSRRPARSHSGPSWEQVLQILAAATDAQTLPARQVSFESPHVPLSAELAGYARVSLAAGAPFLQCVLDLTKRINHDFKFLPGSTEVGTPIADVFHSRQGVCQDFTHPQLGCLRSMGFAARYVSGYVATHPPPG
jgi:transglutaminase-like putative cysteine protease